MWRVYVGFLTACSSTAPHVDALIAVPSGSGPLAAADIDGDHRIDLVSAGQTGVYVLANTSSPGTVSFAAPVVLAYTTEPGSGPGLALADFNGDGRIDIASTNTFRSPGNGLLHVYTNTTAGTSPSFSDPVDLATGGDVADVVTVGDINQDGKPDLAAWGARTPDDSASYIGVFLNTTPAGAAAPTFAPRIDISAVARYIGAQIEIADLTGDGIPDLVASMNEPTNSRDELAILVGTTPSGAMTATFAAPVVLDFGPADSTGACPFAVRDLDGDGALDIAAVHVDSPTVSRLHNATSPGGAPAFTDTTLQIGNTAVTEITVGDLDGDGTPDLAATSYHRLSDAPGDDDGTIAVVRDGKERDYDISHDDYPGALVIADFDGDGTPDIATAMSGIAIDLGPW